MPKLRRRYVAVQLYHTQMVALPLLRGLGKRHEVVYWSSSGFTTNQTFGLRPHRCHPSAGNQPSKDQSQPPTPRYVNPSTDVPPSPRDTRFPPALWCKVMAVVPWPLGPNHEVKKVFLFFADWPNKRQCRAWKQCTLQPFILWFQTRLANNSLA